MISIWSPAGGVPDFIRTLYQNVLEHDPQNQAEVDNWTKHARFLGLSSAINGFFTSDEFIAKGLRHSAVVDKLYRSIFGREPKAVEAIFWLDRLERGDTLRFIIDDMVGSAEYRKRLQNNAVPHPTFAFESTLNCSSLTPCSHRTIFTWNPDGGMSNFIRTLYQNILDRDPENDAVVDYWDKHARFSGLASTFNKFFTLNEFKAKDHPPGLVIDKLFRSILQREHGAEEKLYWLRRFEHGDTLRVAIDELVGNAEYREKVRNNIVPSSMTIFTWDPAGGMADFAKTLYQTVLDRDPENQAAAEHWAEQTRFSGVVSLFNGFFSHQEFQDKNHPHGVVVEKLYRAILRREHEADEKTYWVHHLERGDALQVAITELVMSDEYKEKVHRKVVPSPITIFAWDSAGGLIDWAKTLYQIILDRDPEHQGAAAVSWGNHAETNGLASTLNGFFTSTEFQNKNHSQEVVVDKLYRAIMRREPDVGDKNHCLDRLERGETIGILIRDILDTAEYRAKARKNEVPRSV